MSIAMTTNPQNIVFNGFFYFISIVFIDYVLKSISVKENRNDSLTIFDQRNGYSYEEAISLLTAWGSKGRFIYLIILTIDSFGFIISYSSLLEWLYLWCQGSNNLSWLIFFLTYADYAENVGHAAMAISFGCGLRDHNWFRTLVQYSSLANMTKWFLAKSSIFTLGICFIYKNCK